MDLTSADRALAAGIATATRLDPASPEACAARADRISKARRENTTRLADLCTARELRRKHGVRTSAELLTELNNLVSAMAGCLSGSDLDGWRTKLVDLACDIEDEICAPNHPGCPTYSVRNHLVPGAPRSL